MAGNSPTAEPPTMGGAATEKTANPPPVISVETDVKVEDNDGPSSETDKGFGQARTPKHANKTRDEDGDQQKITPDHGEHNQDESRQQYGQRGQYGNGNFPPPRPYEGRQLGGNGAFQPHEPRRQPHPPSGHGDYYARSPPMHTVSPGGGHHRYYNNNQGRPPRMEGGYPPHSQHHHNGYYEQRGYGDYGTARSSSFDGPPPAYRGQYPPSGPPHAQPYGGQSYNGYSPESRGYSHPPGPGYHNSHYPSSSMPPEHYSRGHEARYPQEHNSGNGTFSRAVSSSFDRSVKSRMSEDKLPSTVIPPKSRKHSSPPSEHDPQDASMASDDLSWKQLKQVHSVDDSAIRERIKKDKEEDNHIQVERQPASTSSSLTNSPTEGPERLHSGKEAQRVVAAAAEAVSKSQPQSSSLDSLSSVASAQAPMQTSKTHQTATSAVSRSDPPPPSPGTDSASLDLMKCSSGSSGLLHLPPHQRNIEGLLFDGKRGRDEERGDINTADAEGAGDEIRRAPSDFEELKNGEEPPPTKKVRLKEEPNDHPKGTDGKAKSSPLSITCSPSAEKSKDLATRSRNRKTDYVSPQPMEGSFYDKPPAYSYSIDSAPSFPRDANHRKSANYPAVPPRPGSSNSSTLTPGAMQVDDQHPSNAAVPSVPSWEIHAQDSFGNGSIGGGHGLTSSFSFQDYPMLSTNESDTGSNGNPPGHGPAPSQPPNSTSHHSGPHPPLESRNQSFDGGHYQGGSGFHRADSMDVSYGGRSGAPPYSDNYKGGHNGQFPPHAPSWGTAGSGGSHPSNYPQGPGHYGQYGGRMGPEYHQGGVMRNYSHDSGHRASPPPGPGGHHRLHPGQRPPPGFQPPSEFAAPQNPHLNRRPPPAVYIMPTSQSGPHHPPARGNGVFSWSKEDDMRLTEIMKKYKNPRDWEPIAKEHGSGKTAKECHERWIRYLKPGVRKGQWTDHEDAIVIEAVTTSTEQPFTRWSDLAQRLPGRVGKQIRDRWVNHLNPNINHLPFSREDDLLLWEGHKKLGKRWVEISTKLFNSSRSENHIKNRWYSASFKKFIANEFGPDAYSGTKTSKGKDESKSKKKGAGSSKEEDPTMQAV